MEIFNLFRKKKEHGFSCDALNHHLQFRHDKIEPCCCANISPILIDDMQDKKWLDNLKKTKAKYIKQMEEGSILPTCKGCMNILPYKKEKDSKINTITINHFTHCNCACIYCTQDNTSAKHIVEEPKKAPEYDIIPFVKELYKKNMIDKENLFVDFQGGDISVLEEADEIINLFLDNGVRYFQFLTSGVKYVSGIEKVLKAARGTLGLSLDSGTPETYLKIKQTDKFYDVVENIKKYLKTTDPANITVKYIIVQGINDNTDEFNRFFDLMEEIGVKNIALDINYRNIINRVTSFVIPEHYYDIYNVAKNRCQASSIELIIPPYTQKVIEQGYSDII